MYEHAAWQSLPGISDPVSSLTHLAGAAVFAILGIFLVRRGRGDRNRVAALLVFVSSCVLLLSLSGVYHALRHDSVARDVLMRLDHAAIFLLIAGSFTPVQAILLNRGWHRHLLPLIWAAAIAGLALKSLYFDAMPEWLGLFMYLGLGWLGLISTATLARRFGLRFTLPLIWGGLAYTVGAVADHAHWPVLLPGIVGPHELFHCAVLAGIAFHWAFIRRIASGANARFLHPEVPMLNVLARDEVR